MTKYSNNGISRRDEILVAVLRVCYPDMKQGDYESLLKKFELSAPEINEIKDLYFPFRDMRGKFAMAIWELAEADRADNASVPQSHPAYMSRVQRLAIGRLSAMLAFLALKKSWNIMAPMLVKAQEAVDGSDLPENVDSAVMLIKLQAAQTLCAAVKTFINMRWKNILDGRSDAEINALLAPIHYAYRHVGQNSPVLYRNGEEGELLSVNLADLALGFRTKSGHFMVRRRIESMVPSPYEFDWALTANPETDELIYRADDFAVTNGTFMLDRHQSVYGVEFNEIIAQRHNWPVQSMPFSQWKPDEPLA